MIETFDGNGDPNSINDGGYRCLSPGFQASTKIQLLDGSYLNAFATDKDASIWLSLIDDKFLYLSLFKGDGTIESRYMA